MSNADEIKKLKALLDDEVITEEEYQNEKNKILNNDTEKSFEAPVVEQQTEKKKGKGCLWAMVIIVFMVVFLVSAVIKSTPTNTTGSPNRNTSKKLESTTEKSASEYIEKLEETPEEIINKIDIIEDDVEVQKKYKSKLSPQYSNVNGFYIAFIEKNGKFSKPYVRFQYTGKEWVFFDSIVINSDGKIVDEITAAQSGKNEDTFNGGVYETFTTNKEFVIYDLIVIAKSEKSTIRYKGKNNYFDYVVTEEDKKAIKDIIDAYQLKSKKYYTDWKESD